MRDFFKKINIALFIGVFATVISAPPIMAHGGETAGQASRNHSNTREAINARMTNMEQLLANTIRLLGGQVSGNLQNQIAADANLAQTEDERSRQREIERVRFEAMQKAETASNTCKMITRAITSPVYGNSAAVEQMMMTNQSVDEIVSVMTGKPSATTGTPVTGGSPSQAAEIIAQHQASRYCSPEQVKAGNCTQDQVVSPELQDAHLNANSILTSTETIATEEEANACQDFILNNSGRPVGGIIQNAASRSTNSAEAYVDRTAYAGRLSLSSKIMMNYCNRRKSIEDGDPTGFYNQIASDMGENFPENASWFEAFRLMSSGFISGENISKIEENSEEIQVLKDLYYVVGWLSYQNMELYRLIDTQNVTQAAQLQVLNEMLYLQKRGETTYQQE
jgi:hypothetical protein